MQNVLKSVKVWDPFIRIFHWVFVASFVVAWMAADDARTVHIGAGYLAGALIIFRLIWGVVGPHYARFSQFVRSPRETIEYARKLAAGREPRYIGHDPLGAVSIVAILALTMLVVVTGWMLVVGSGQTAAGLIFAHEALSYTLLAVVVAHVLGILFISVRHQDNMLGSMVTGEKDAARPGDIA